MEKSDILMLMDYEKCGKFLDKSEKDIKELRIKLVSLENDKSLENIDYIFGHMWFMVDTFYMYKISCNLKNELSQPFFNIPAFKRANLETINILLVKIDGLLNNNKELESEIINKFNSIFIRLGIGRESRNKLEYDIDPYYDGKLEELEEKFSLNIQLMFVRELIEFFEMLKGKSLTIKKDQLQINYMALELDVMKNITTNSVEIMCEMFTYIDQLSWLMYENKIEKSDELRNCMDLGLKLNELNKSIIYIYNGGTDLFKTVKVHFTIKEYFCRVALFKAYQICDKLGLYITNKRGSYFNTTYLKKVIDKLEKDNCEITNIEKMIISMRKSSEYESLSKVRNFIEHKNEKINYENEINKLHSILVIMYSELSNIVLAILKEYIEDNGVTISGKVLSEIEQKKRYIKI